MEENSVDLLSRILDEAQTKEVVKKKKSKFGIVFLIISIILFVNCIFLLVVNEQLNVQLQEQIGELQEENELLKKRYQTATNARDNYMHEAENANEELLFWKKNAVIVTESGEKYHTYGCQYIVGAKATILYYKTAENRGYKPCSVCLPNGLGGRLYNIEQKECGINWDDAREKAKELEKEMKENGFDRRTTQ